MLLVLASGFLLGQSRVVPEVRELRLANGLEVLCVERPGSGALHAALFLKGGRGETGSLPPCAADLLGQSLFRKVTAADLRREASLDALMREEEGLYEGLRLEQLKGERLQPGEPSPEAQGLAVAHGRVMASLKARTGLEDVLGELGAIQRRVAIEADYIVWSADLPARNLKACAAALGSLLSHAQLSRLPEERERLLKLEDPAQLPLSVLLSTAALPGVYGVLGERPREAFQSLRWTDMKVYAKKALVPERMTLVLVGDLSAAGVSGLLEPTLGKLPSGGDLRPMDQWTGSISPWEGARRLKATVPRKRRVFMAWRVPPLSHPDAPTLQLLCQILATGNASRLVKTLKDDQGLVQQVTATMGVPGGREANLLVIDAEPVEGHSIEELEQAISSEMRHLYSEPLREGELQRALRQAEALAQRTQEDAGVLAQALGAAKCQTGDWRSAFATVRLGPELRQESIQAVIRRYLSPTQSLTVLLEPDALTSPRDALEAQLVRVLERLAQRRTLDAARVDTIIRDVLHQVRMLPPAERQKTLNLLESQVKP